MMNTPPQEAPPSPRAHTKLAIAFLDRLGMAVQQQRTHTETSRLLHSAIDDLVESFRLLVAETSDLELRFTRDMVVVNQYLAHVQGLSGHAELDVLCQLSRKIGLGSIVISAHVPRTGLEFLAKHLAICINQPDSGRLDWLMGEVALHFTESIDIIATGSFEEIVADSFDLGEDSRDDVALRLYCTIVALSRYVHGHPIPPGENIERMLQQGFSRLAKLVKTHLDAVLACASLWLPTDYLPAHAVNRSFLAAALAQRAGLDERSIEIVADAALHADLGMLEVPDDWREMGGELLPNQRQLIRHHTERGAWKAIGRGGADPNIRARSVVALQHHMGASGGGYPATGEPPHLFSRICTIADIYDALCSERGDREAYAPPHALQLLTTELLPQVDAKLAKAFAAMLGPYPPGTPVLLDTGEVGVVRRPSPDAAHAERPTVFVVGDPEEWYRTATEVDLLTDPEGGAVVGMPYPDEVPFAPGAVYFKPEVLYEG